MANRSDWLPGTRTGQLTMAKDWKEVMAAKQWAFGLVFVTGSANDPANKGFRVYYRVVAPGETPPASPEDLTKSFFTKRKKDVIEFGFNDSGSTVFFAVQVENEGKKGPWGPMTSALIP